MPTYTRGDLRQTLTAVKVTNPNLYYMWNTKDFASQPGISGGDLTALGHLTPAQITATQGAIAVIGCNRPKPARAIKILNATPDAATQGKASTFVGLGSEGTAISAGWKLGDNRKGVSIRQGGRSITVAAPTSNGGIYAFSMNSADAATYAVDLGLSLPANITSGDRNKMFQGATRPRPPKVQKVVGAAKFSSYCDPAKVDDLLDAGWSLIEDEVLLVLGAQGA